MKPRLNINGRKYNIVSVEVQDDETLEKKYFYEADYYNFMDDEKRCNFSESIELPFVKSKIMDDINQLLEDSNDYLLDLEKQMITELMANNGLPFGDNTIDSIVKEYKQHKDYIDGVASALEVVKGDDYEEDVQA